MSAQAPSSAASPATVVSAAAGAGVGSLIGGASPASAMKSALFAGAVGFAASGVSSMMQGGTFMGGVQNALPESFGGGLNTVEGGGKQLGFLEAMKGGPAPAVTPPSDIGSTTGTGSNLVSQNAAADAARSFDASTASSGSVPKAPVSSGGALSGLGGGLGGGRRIVLLVTRTDGNGGGDPATPRRGWMVTRHQPRPSPSVEAF